MLWRGNAFLGGRLCTDVTVHLILVAYAEALFVAVLPHASTLLTMVAVAKTTADVVEVVAVVVATTIGAMAQTLTDITFGIKKNAQGFLCIFLF